MTRTARSTLAALQQQARSLPLHHKRQLLQWLQELIAEEENPSSLDRPPIAPGRELIQEQRVGAIIYRQERVRCGKPNCKCAAGELHGPYWYAYQRQEGKLKSRYIGKHLNRND